MMEDLYEAITALGIKQAYFNGCSMVVCSEKANFIVDGGRINAFLYLYKKGSFDIISEYMANRMDKK